MRPGGGNTFRYQGKITTVANVKPIFFSPFENFFFLPARR